MTSDVAERPRSTASPRLKRLVVGLVAGLVAATLIGSAFAPVLLLEAPLLLILLAPDARHLALLVGSVSPPLLVSLAVLRRLLYSASAFGLGAVYGDTATAWVEGRSARIGRLFRLIERLFARWGAAILVVWPFGSACILAGVAHTRLLTFLVAAGVGHTLWVLSIYAIGELIADFTARVLAFLAEHLLESTLVCIAIVVVQQVAARRRAARRRRADLEV